METRGCGARHWTERELPGPPCGGGEAVGLVGGSEQMRALRARLRDLARTPSSVLLEGETGTGKGVAARALHAWSERRRAPFVHVDCAALTPSLIESELFGHERGAFTGAGEQRPGRLELAGQGTLFLDEIGELAPPLQAKLLRVLQDRTFERVGGTRTHHLQARVVAATNVDLASATRAGRFRPDLYFRLCVARVVMPPLRVRPGDLPGLVDHVLDVLAVRLACPRPRPTSAFLDALARHPWPGNVRQLGNLLEQLLALGVGPELQPSDLVNLDEGPWAQQASEPPCEAARIAEVLREVGGNVSRAARRLEMPRTSLRRRIRRYGLQGLIPRD